MIGDKNISIKLAFDNEAESDMIHIKIYTSTDLKPKLEALNLFQCLFKRLDIEE